LFPSQRAISRSRGSAAGAPGGASDSRIPAHLRAHLHRLEPATTCLANHQTRHSVILRPALYIPSVAREPYDHQTPVSRDSLLCSELDCMQQRKTWAAACSSEPKKNRGAVWPFLIEFLPRLTAMSGCAKSRLNLRASARADWQ